MLIKLVLKEDMNTNFRNSDDFLLDLSEYYKSKLWYLLYKIDNYLIYFSPNFGIMEFF